jgi:hypothetical protein
MWSTERIFRIAIAITIVGAIVGAGCAAVVSIVDQLGLPAGPSIATTPVAVVVGSVVGLLLGLAAAMGGSLALCSIGRLTRLSALQRALIVGLAAGMAAFLPALVLFTQPFIIQGSMLTGGSVLVVFVGVALAVRFCETRQRKTRS